MKRAIKLITATMFAFTVILSGCTTNKAATNKTAKSDDNQIQSKIQKYMKDYTASNQFIGSVLVAKKEQVLFEKGYGMADDDNKILNTPKTAFEIGSITKQFTATAILMLQEKGLLNVQDTINKYIPDYPNGNNIKIFNLLNHTSGIPEYSKLVDMEPGNHTYTPENIIEIFKNKPLDFDPGTKFEYSNSNYILLGYIIEKVTGASYEDYINNNIFAPLKMKNTGFLNSRGSVGEKAIGYSYISPKSIVYEKAPDIEPSLTYAAGGIYSTVGDLLIWINTLQSEKLISKDSLKEMFTPYLGDYGFGWFVEKIDGVNVVDHGGNISGFTSYIMYDMDKGYVVIILSNKGFDNSNLEKLGKGLLDAVSK